MTVYSPMPPAPLPPRRDGWATAIGVIAIVFGGFGILGGGLGMLTPVINRVMLDLMPEEQAVAFEVAQRYEWWTVGSMTAYTALAAWLLWGGIGLVRRNPEAVPRLRNWAWAKAVYVVLAGVLGAVIQAETQAAVRGHMGAAAASGFQATLNAWVAVVSVVFGVVWGLAFPVFVWVWFRRASVLETVEGWDESDDRV